MAYLSSPQPSKHQFTITQGHDALLPKIMKLESATYEYASMPKTTSLTPKLI
jgi:hypothetical protein